MLTIIICNFNKKFVKIIKYIHRNWEMIGFRKLNLHCSGNPVKNAFILIIIMSIVIKMRINNPTHLHFKLEFYNIETKLTRT